MRNIVFYFNLYYVFIINLLFKPMDFYIGLFTLDFIY